MNPNPPVSLPAVVGLVQVAPLPPVLVVGARGLVAAGFDSCGHGEQVSGLNTE